MKCVRSTIQAVTLGVGFAVLLGCSAVIPDYNHRNDFGKPTPPEVRISFAPAYPQICANAKTPDGKWYRSVTIFVRLVSQEPAEVSLMINGSNELLMEAPVGSSHAFRYPAGAGRHNIEIWVKSDPIQYFSRSFTVAPCGASSAIRAYQP